MEDHNSPEAVEARANQEDPIIMYLVVRTSLEMSIGKTVAQGGHAVQMLQLKYDLLSKSCDWIATSHGDPSAKQIAEDVMLYQTWMGKSFRKVVLACKDKDWEKIKAAVPNHVVVVDAGLTEVNPGSETVIGLWPMRKSQAPKAVQRLQVLK